MAVLTCFRQKLEIKPTEISYIDHLTARIWQGRQQVNDIILISHYTDIILILHYIDIILILHYIDIIIISHYIDIILMSPYIDIILILHYIDNNNNNNNNIGNIGYYPILILYSYYTGDYYREFQQSKFASVMRFFQSSFVFLARI